MKLTGKVTRAASGNLIDCWYDRQSRDWVIQTKDAGGNQIGDAMYVGCRDEAESEASTRLKDEGGPTEK